MYHYLKNNNNIIIQPCIINVFTIYYEFVYCYCGEEQ